MHQYWYIFGPLQIKIAFIQNIKKMFSKNSIILCIKFRQHTIFTFSFMLFLIMYSYKASIYHNVIKAQWHRSPTTQRKNRLKNINFLKSLSIFICILFIVFNFIIISKKFHKYKSTGLY